MRVRNAHTATLGMPGGKDIAPGASGEADGRHPVVAAWLKAGYLVEEEPARVVEAPAEESTPKGRRGSK